MRVKTESKKMQKKKILMNIWSVIILPPLVFCFWSFFPTEYNPTNTVMYIYDMFSTIFGLLGIFFFWGILYLVGYSFIYKDTK